MVNLETFTADFTKIMERFKGDLDQLRTGRANASILDMVMVEAYGSRTALKGLASVAVPDARTLTVEPWDKSILKEVEKAIVEANIGLNPINDGRLIRLVMPAMTEESRKNLLKVMGQKAESARISVRQLRDNIRDKVVAEEKAKTLNEDQRFQMQEKLDKTVKDYNDKIKLMAEAKEKEIMTI